MRVVIFLKKYWLHLLAALAIISILSWPLVLISEDSFFVPYLPHFFSGEQHLVKTENKVLPEKKEVSNVIVFGGDIMLSRTVNKKMQSYGDYAWPFRKISSLFSEADLAVANLESPFLFSNNYNVNTGSFSFKANPKSVQALTLAGFLPASYTAVCKYATAPPNTNLVPDNSVPSGEV